MKIWQKVVLNYLVTSSSIFRYKTTTWFQRFIGLFSSHQAKITFIFWIDVVINLFRGKSKLVLTSAIEVVSLGLITAKKDKVFYICSVKNKLEHFLRNKKIIIFMTNPKYWSPKTKPSNTFFENTTFTGGERLVIKLHLNQIHLSINLRLIS